MLEVVQVSLKLFRIGVHPWVLYVGHAVERHYRDLSVLGFVHRFLELLEGALGFSVKGLKMQKYFEAVFRVFRRSSLHLNCKNILRPFWRFQTMFTSFKLQKYFEAVLAFSDDVYFILTKEIF